MNGSIHKNISCPTNAGQQKAEDSAGGERYWVALDAALLILETVDASPPSNGPARLAKVIGICLDAIYEAERGRQP